MNAYSAAIASEIESDIQGIENDTMLYMDKNFNSRANAVDFIDFHIIDRINGLLENGIQQNNWEALKLRAEKIKYQLEEIDTNLFKQLREKIRTRVLTGTSLKNELYKYLEYDISDKTQLDKVGYDNLDVFINGLLSDQALPEAMIERNPEMVFYQKTPARIVFEMAERAELNNHDVFYDLGSGLGQVTILVNLLTGTQTKGIEFEPAYFNYARKCASELGLLDIEFINNDALKADYSQGTVFFMYTPFEGTMLQQVLDILREESSKREIRIFTYGPCSSQVAKQGWLGCVNPGLASEFILYEFISLRITLD